MDLDILLCIRSACAQYSALKLPEGLDTQVFDFLLDRFRAWYQAEGISAEVFQAVFQLKPSKPWDFNLRILAVHRFSQLAEAQSLASANKRVSNILLKQGDATDANNAVDPSLFTEPAEQQLADTLERCRLVAEPMFQRREYTAGLEALAVSS